MTDQALREITNLREINKQLLTALKSVTGALSSARLLMTDTETRVMASGIVATAQLVIAEAEQA